MTIVARHPVPDHLLAMVPLISMALYWVCILGSIAVLRLFGVSMVVSSATTDGDIDDDVPEEEELLSEKMRPAFVPETTKSNPVKA